NNVELGRHGRSRSNVWQYPGVNTFRAGRLDELQSHPTVKPVSLVADAMKDCTRRGDIVLDTFCGSGTTILAAERVGRRAFALEIEPRFVDVAIRRWQAFTRKDAIHLNSGQGFDELAVDRIGAVGPADAAGERGQCPNSPPAEIPTVHIRCSVKRTTLQPIQPNRIARRLKHRNTPLAMADRPFTLGTNPVGPAMPRGVPRGAAM